MKIVNQIRSLREKKGISSKSFAASLDIDLSTLNRIENGRITSFKPRLLFKMADLLGVEVPQLFGRSPNLNDMPDIQIIDQTRLGNLKTTVDMYQKLLSARESEITALKDQIALLKKEA